MKPIDAVITEALDRIYNGESMESKQTALTVVERASLAIRSSEYEPKLRELAARSAAITAITNADGYKECHSARMALKRERIALECDGKTARDDATAFAKAVIAEEKRLVGIIAPEESRLQAIQDAHDAKAAAEKARKEQAERERITTIRARIEAIKARATVAYKLNAAEVQTLIAAINDEAFERAGFSEFADEAQAARDAALEYLSEVYVTKAAQEAEAKRIADERAELVRLQDDERLRQALAREEEDQRAKAAQEKRDADAAAERKRLDDEARTAREAREAADAKARTEREEADRIASEARAAEEKVAKERQAELDARQYGIDRQRREQEERERVAQAALVAEEKRRQDAIAAEHARTVEEERQRQEAARIEAEKAEAARVKAAKFAAAKRPTVAMALEQILFVANNRDDYTDAEARAEIAVLAEANMPVASAAPKRRPATAQAAE